MQAVEWTIKNIHRYLTNIVKGLKSRKIGWAGKVARTGRREILFIKTAVRKPEW
jgi:hypothetical protein